MYEPSAEIHREDLVRYNGEEYRVQLLDEGGNATLYKPQHRHSAEPLNQNEYTFARIEQCSRVNLLSSFAPLAKTALGLPDPTPLHTAVARGAAELGFNVAIQGESFEAMMRLVIAGPLTSANAKWEVRNDTVLDFTFAATHQQGVADFQVLDPAIERNLRASNKLNELQQYKSDLQMHNSTVRLQNADSVRPYTQKVHQGNVISKFGFMIRPKPNRRGVLKLPATVQQGIDELWEDQVRQTWAQVDESNGFRFDIQLQQQHPEFPAPQQLASMQRNVLLDHRPNVLIIGIDRKRPGSIDTNACEISEVIRVWYRYLCFDVSS